MVALGIWCSGKFVAPENYSHTQQYGLGLRLRIGLNLGLALALVTLWQYGGGKNFPGATNFSRHRVTPKQKQHFPDGGAEIFHLQNLKKEKVVKGSVESFLVESTGDVT